MKPEEFDKQFLAVARQQRRKDRWTASTIGASASSSSPSCSRRKQVGRGDQGRQRDPRHVSRITSKTAASTNSWPRRTRPRATRPSAIARAGTLLQHRRPQSRDAQETRGTAGEAGQQAGGRRHAGAAELYLPARRELHQRLGDSIWSSDNRAARSANIRPCWP